MDSRQVPMIDFCDHTDKLLASHYHCANNWVLALVCLFLYRPNCVSISHPH
jgi:hypothetical protein